MVLMIYLLARIPRWSSTTALPHSVFSTNARFPDKYPARKASHLEAYKSGTESKAFLLSATFADLSKKSKVLHVDDSIIVLSKPSGLPTVRGSRGIPNSLASVAHKIHRMNGDGGGGAAVTDNVDIVDALATGPSDGFGMTDGDDVLIDDDGMTEDRMVAHRLDMDTSGIVVFGRSLESVRRLHCQFREGKVSKVYEALVAGSRHLTVGDEFIIENEICRDALYPPWMTTTTELSRFHNQEAINEGQGTVKWQKMLTKSKSAVTEVSVVGHEIFFGMPATRVRLVPRTGRTHQLRVHLAGLGCPIIGDDLYGVNGIACRYGGIGENLVSEDDKEVEKEVQDRFERFYKGGNLLLHSKEIEIDGVDEEHLGQRMVFCDEQVPF